MTPAEFEEAIARHLRREGYRTEVTGGTNDFCVDILATKGTEKVAVQCKMYGGASRRVNHAAIFELYGAAAYFDCS